MAQRIPEQLISDIIAANDIVSLVSQHVQLRRSGSSYVGLCPFHKEKTPSFHVTPDRQLYYCFGCGAGGNVVDFVKNTEHLDFVEAIRFLAERAGIRVDNEVFTEEEKKRFEKKQRMLLLHTEAARFFRDRLFAPSGAEKAQNYVKARGLRGSTVKTYGIGYAPDTWDALCRHFMENGYGREELVEAGLATFTKTGKVIDRFRDRLMFPIMDVRGNVIGFGGRILGEGNVKYLNSPETPVFNKGQNLFSLQLAKKYKELILVEGYMDVISLYQYGVENAVASLGTALTPDQARLCARHVEKVTICYDTDGAGVKAAMRAIEVFKGIDIKLRILSLPEGKDPDEFIKTNGEVRFRELLEKADTPAGFQLRNLRRQYNIDDAGQKLEYVEAAAKIISEVPSPVERELLRERISKETGVRSTVIETEVDKKLDKKQKREKYETQKSVTKPAPVLKSSSQDKLLSLALKDRALYKKYKDKIMALDLDAVHSKILEYLEETDDAAQIIGRFTEKEESAKAAAALSMPVHYENRELAMRELLAAIQKEAYNLKVKEAIESGDLSMLNTLLMKKDSDREGGR